MTNGATMSARGTQGENIDPDTSNNTASSTAAPVLDPSLIPALSPWVLAALGVGLAFLAVRRLG